MGKGRVASFGRARSAQALRAVVPSAVLARGYAVVKLAGQRTIVRSVDQIGGGERLELRVADGTFAAEASPREREC